MDTENFNQRVLKAGFWYVISTIMVRGISFLTTPFFTRLLTREQYGFLTVYESWLRILLPILTLSLYASVERAKYEFEAEYDAYIASIQSVMTGLCMGAAVITALFHKQIGGMLHMTDLMLAVMIFYVWAQAVINSVQRREKLLLQYRQNIAVTACATVVPTVLSMIILNWCKTAGWQEELLTIRILSFYIPQMITGAALAVVVYQRGHGRFAKKHLQFAVLFSLPLIPHVLSMEILNQSDKIMVSRLAGDEKAGIYSLGVTIMWVVLLLSQAIGDAWLPWLYQKLRCKKYMLVEKAWKEMIKLFGMFGWMIVAFAPEIVWIFGGEDYKDAVRLVGPLTVGGMAHFFSYSYIAVEQYYKKNIYVMLVSITAVVLNILLNYIGIMRWGYEAAAYATAWSYAFMIAAHAVLLKINLGSTFISAKVTAGVFLFYLGADFITVFCYKLPFFYRLVFVITAAAVQVRQSYGKIRVWIKG